MKHVRLRITADGREDEVHPVYDLVTNAPFVDYATALQWNFTGDALGILHHMHGDADAFCEAVESIPEVVGYDLLPDGDDEFYVYVRDATTEPLRELFAPVTRGGLVIVPPVRYDEDGTVSFSLFGPGDEVQAAIDHVPSPVKVTVESVSGLAGVSPAVKGTLSDRQRAAVEAALDVGYYDVPRTGSQEDVADRLGCSPSTAAEHLRKAESKAFRSLFG